MKVHPRVRDVLLYFNELQLQTYIGLGEEKKGKAYYEDIIRAYLQALDELSDLQDEDFALFLRAAAALDRELNKCVGEVLEIKQALN